MIDVSLNNLSVSGNTTMIDVSLNNLSVNNKLNVLDQATFNIPPQCTITPTLGNDLVNKGYVDSLIGQYSGGFNLFFNYSLTDTQNGIIYNVLSQAVTNTPQQFVDVNITSGTLLVAQFITSQFNITQIPVGLWNTLLYGSVNDTSDEITYSIRLSKLSSGNIEPDILATSANSIDINASPNDNPAAYNMNLTITSPISLVLTDRLLIGIYITRIRTGSSITVRTYFENSYYSFTQSTLNAGTTLLSSNNTWSGTNNYSLGITCPSIDTTGSLSLGNTTANTISIGSNNTTNITNLCSTININKTNSSPNTINIGSTTSTINLGETTSTKINSFPISPVSESITYSTTTGTQIIGSIGYILQGTLVSNGGLTSTTSYNMGTMVIDKGVWMVTGNVGYSTGDSTNLHEVSIWLATSAIDDDFNGFMTSGVITTNRTAEIGTRGIWSFDSLSTLRLRFRVDYTGGGMNQNNVNWAFKAVRIA
jgi:hypothetical protein